MKSKFKTFLIFILIIISPTICYAWGPITHYYINKETQDNYTFNTAGILTDSFMKSDWDNPAQSPIPFIDKKTNIDWSKKPNFGFILNKIARNEQEKQFSLGWGAHISADWVAHGKYFIQEGNINEFF